MIFRCGGTVSSTDTSADEKISRRLAFYINIFYMILVAEQEIDFSEIPEGAICPDPQDSSRHTISAPNLDGILSRNQIFR